MDDLADIPPEKFPRHVAVIMDGNGRWAVRRGLERVRGHQQGARSVRDVVTECARLRKDRGGPDVLTLYSFSLENWKRPVDEVTFLMQMYIDYLRSERATMMENNIRFRQIGRLDHLPEPVTDEVDRTLAETAKNDGLTLVLALNYSSRAEITDAVRAIAAKVKAGELDARDVTESTVSDHLYTAGMPDPDLLIRTAGEMRVSNYLLWQISYAELVVSDVLWPDFGVAELHHAIREFSRRNRRFGALDHTNTLAKR
ncbi:MAG: Undecaprenyl diphosphate synthase [uncultured Phycisphaerae bacterium]|uniref:Isoprenyl transferase n=1 Tax=uncultured Phycisphaerae bacterium TaxID=904963 RepID=A0A6J4QMI9_9BACT|nr:MAG: Undecaprenyl diphosphate synthase [uncultured Phycisphaerae bacterium]